MRQTDSALAQALGEKRDEYFSLNNTDVIEADFAKKSRFHKQIMSDGYVFNPYVHRRWLPVQYLRLRRYNNNTDWYVKTHYDFNYMVDYIIKEANKLYLLSLSDKYAFEERRLFFTENCIKSIFKEYLVVTRSRFVDRNNMWELTSGIFINGYGYAPENWTSTALTLVSTGTKRREKTVISLDPIIQKLDRLLDQLDKADTYYEICKIMKETPYIKHSMHCYATRRVDKSAFTNAFLLSGAYYTCKHLAMFGSLKVAGKQKADACKFLRDMLSAGATFEEFDKLLD